MHFIIFVSSLVIFLHYLLRGQINFRSQLDHFHLSFVLKSQTHTSQDIAVSLMRNVRLPSLHNFVIKGTQLKKTDFKSLSMRKYVCFAGLEISTRIGYFLCHSTWLFPAFKREAICYTVSSYLNRWFCTNYILP